MQLISQMRDCLSGVTDWAELPLTRHALSAHGRAGDVGSSQKCPLSGRKALFYCYVGESEKSEIKKIKQRKKEK